MAKAKSIAVAPGSNWAALQSKIAPAPKSKASGSASPGPASNATISGGGKRPRGGPSIMSGELSNKQRKRQMMKGLGGYVGGLGEKVGESSSSAASTNTVKIDAPAHAREAVTLLPVPEDCTDRRLVEELRVMVAGKGVLSEAKKGPGTYIALDCEMVGLGPQGSESCLARISVVNYHGHVLLDTFVQPRETVTDWRTWISGIRPSDVAGAPHFEDVQKQVSSLCEGRVVVGHALENDMKALLLSHPGPMTRDTQQCKPLREKARTKRPGLKKLVEMELGIRIQTGAHSSVTDARATMALYRLHKTVWEQQVRSITETYREKMGLPAMGNTASKGKEKASSAAPDESSGGAGKGGKRKRGGEDDDEGGTTARYEDEGGLLHAALSEDKWTKKKQKKKEGGEGGGVKGISSGVTEVIRHKDGTREVRGRRGAGGGGASAGGGGNWWEDDAGG